MLSSVSFEELHSVGFVALIRRERTGDMAKAGEDSGGQAGAPGGGVGAGVGASCLCVPPGLGNVPCHRPLVTAPSPSLDFGARGCYSAPTPRQACWGGWHAGGLALSSGRETQRPLGLGPSPVALAILT